MFFTKLVQNLLDNRLWLWHNPYRSRNTNGGPNNEPLNQQAYSQSTAPGREHRLTEHHGKADEVHSTAGLHRRQLSRQDWRDLLRSAVRAPPWKVLHRPLQ